VILLILQPNLLTQIQYKEHFVFILVDWKVILVTGQLH